MKDYICIFFTIVGAFIGFIIGRFIHHNFLNNIGATMITPKDVVSCYVLPIVICGALGFWLSAKWLFTRRH